MLFGTILALERHNNIVAMIITHSQMYILGLYKSRVPFEMDDQACEVLSHSGSSSFEKTLMLFVLQSAEVQDLHLDRTTPHCYWFGSC